MFRLATSTSRKSKQRGSALIITLVVMVSLVGLLFAASSMSTIEVKQSRTMVNDVRSDYVAQAGVERGINFLSAAAANSTMANPLGGLANLFGAGPTFSPFIGTPLLNGTERVGAYSVTLTNVAQTATSITIAIDATGYMPDAPSALPPGQQVTSWKALRTTVRYSLAPSEVFDYGYFINNWGWFYGSTIYCYGNARSNGQFDCGGYAPTMTGQPLYDGLTWTGGNANLSGYRDDNNDGLSDGNDGGLWSAWDIVNSANMQGNAGNAANQHDFQPVVEMPNLTDLTQYEAAAIAQNGSIRIDGVEYSDAVLGDEPGEKQHIYLVGTTAKPIEISGSVVIRGDVIIRGVVQGQGAIYAGGNVYVPNSVTYKTGPAQPRPANNTQASTEAWLTANKNKDFLGLFARENIVVGDHTNATWRFYVNGWMNDSLNVSAEDSGTDGIPHTRKGRDGILGTADDDVLEGDGLFSVQTYTAADEAAGIIPPGYDVGDAIPSSGEDIDGDGVYDGTATLAAVTLTTPMTPANFAGNIPPGGVATYSSIASMSAHTLEAVFYTNHTFCWTVLGGTAAKINGALVSRNENIIYGTPSMTVNQDCRLLGGASSMAANWLPLTIQPVEVMRWVELDRDPNKFLVGP
jgi:hypothetical protein